MLSFFPRGVLDEILNLIESVSEGFPSYSMIVKAETVKNFRPIFRLSNLVRGLPSESGPLSIGVLTL